MPVFTFKHCIFCFKQVSSRFSASAGVLSQNAEICRRFCTLSSRYLDIDPSHFSAHKTLKSKLSVNMESVCDDCLEPASSFCDIYSQMEYVKMQMDWRIAQICTLMRKADRKDSPNAEFRQKLEEKMGNVGGTMVDIDGFRNEFLKAASSNSSSPRLIVKKLIVESSSGEDSDSDESYFIPITPVKGKKAVNRSPSPPANNSPYISSSEFDDDVKIKIEVGDMNELAIQPQPLTNKPQADGIGSIAEPRSTQDETRRIIIIKRSSSISTFTKSDKMGFKCGKCPKSFKSRHQLRKHEAVIHHVCSTGYVCPICDGKQKYRTNFQTHLRKPSQKCLRMRPIGFDYLSVDIDECKVTPEKIEEGTERVYP